MKRVNWYYKFLIAFLFFFSMFFLLTKNMSKIINTSAYKNYITFISVPFNYLKEYNIFDYKSVKEENENLKEELLLITPPEEYENIKNENNELKELLKLEQLYTDYNKVYSKPVTRNKMYWFNTMTIDKGKEDNVKENDIVITNKGLIGTITNVTKDFSTVRLITSSNNENKISVAVKKDKNYYHGTIIEYDYPYLKIELIIKEKNIKIGDEIVTSGLGNLPKNIQIGKIEKIEEDEYAMTNILYIKPYQDMNNISYMAVLTK